MTVQFFPPPPPIPSSWADLEATYGDIRHFIRHDGTLSPEWEAENIIRIGLPQPTRYAGTSTMITRITVHRLVATLTMRMYDDIHAAGLWHLLGPYGGGFAFRVNKNNGAVLSLHAWGLAHDWGPEEFPNGSLLRRDPALVEVFAKYGYMCGQDFRHRRDPMHFQRAVGI